MPRNDYDEIKKKFGIFIETWNNKKLSELDDFMLKEITCYMNVAGAYADGSQHTLYGVKCFIEAFPKTDLFHTRICNFVCKFNSKVAKQTAAVACEAIKKEKNGEIKTFNFTALFANCWIKVEKKWMIKEIRMDICGESGDFDGFREQWFFDKNEIKFYPGIHYSCICGELDSPWNVIGDSEDVLNEEEKISETVYRYFYGVDTLSFENLNETLSNDLNAYMEPWGCMNKRHYMECLKFHRQKDRYWAHPVRKGKLIIDGDKAVGKYYRMSGHRLRTHPYKNTKDTINIEKACGLMKYEFKKENGIWRISKWDYNLGIVELGDYSGNIYGE